MHIVNLGLDWHELVATQVDLMMHCMFAPSAAV
jgi:hypothetical protein